MAKLSAMTKIDRSTTELKRQDYKGFSEGGGLRPSPTRPKPEITPKGQKIPPEPE